MAHFVSAIDTVVDFGDLQIFEGFTTYPAIITVRRAPTANEDGQEGELRFLNIKSDVPEDLARAFRADAQAMPRARLGDGSWQLEGDRRAALRAKIKARKKTLGEVYGPPLRGIVTGLNEAFIVSRARRDELVARDARSAELLVPFLRGENIKRWRVESEDLFLINIPKGKFKIDDYPAVRDHLLPFKPALEARATKQEWFDRKSPQHRLWRSRIVLMTVEGAGTMAPRPGRNWYMPPLAPDNADDGVIAESNWSPKADILAQVDRSRASARTNSISPSMKLPQLSQVKPASSRSHIAFIA